MKKLLPSLVCGFSAGVFSIIPMIKSFSCCLFLPFAAYISLVLYIKANKISERIKAGTAAALGLYTGIFASLFGTAFDLLLTLVLRSNEITKGMPEIKQLLEGLPDKTLTSEMLSMMQMMSNEITQYGFSGLYAFLLMMNNFIVFSIFGIIGALIGMQSINKKLEKVK